MLHGGKLTSTSHTLVLIIVGMLLSLAVELWRTVSTDGCLRGIWMITGMGSSSSSESISATEEASAGSFDISYLYFGILPLLIFKPSFDVDYNFILRNIDSIIVLGSSTLLTLVVSLRKKKLTKKKFEKNFEIFLKILKKI